MIIRPNGIVNVKRAYGYKNVVRILLRCYKFTLKNVFKFNEIAKGVLLYIS